MRNSLSWVAKIPAQLGAFGLAASLVLVTACGEDKKRVKKGPAVDEKSQALCRKISKRSRRCVEVLVPLAQRRARSMLESAVAKVPPSRRAALQKQMKRALAKHRESLKETLSEALKKPFMDWCLRAAGDPEQKKLLERTARCLKSPDCQTYGTCLDAVMKTAEKEFYKGFTPPRLPREAASTGDATQASPSDGDKTGSAAAGDGGVGSAAQGADGGVQDGKKNPRQEDVSNKAKETQARPADPSRKGGELPPRGRPAKSR